MGNFRGDASRERGGIEEGNLPYTAFAGDDVIKEHLGRLAQRGDDSDSGDDNSAFCPVADHKKGQRTLGPLPWQIAAAITSFGCLQCT
jgi:hypothetical protein